MQQTLKKPLILITNDDGDAARGIAVLTQIMMQLGDVVVMAPDGPRSGQSNAITVSEPLRYRKIEEREGLVRYICTGTPTDCVKLALHDILDRKPDLLVSGINHGSNAAINVIYSGTMGAVLEGCENGVTSIGFSINDHTANADFSVFEPYILKIAQETMKNGLPYGICLNVNAPADTIKGVKIARQCRGNWTEEYEKRLDPQGRNYFWLTGYFKNHEPESKDTDEWALANKYISIVPTKIDLTDFDSLKTLQNWDLTD
ncbi:MAG: 5'/3'-nucleotidase SurE [Porphyromonadaceae bacterium CG2_30_38_12]|nr:MAG: 5'/3'-nucleotidase SurE [Porphyromonadaceae bacterium CG2_30_38_12]